MKKTLLITLEYPPFIGGVANHLVNIVRQFSVDKIVVLANKQTEDDLNFDKQEKYKIIRTDFFSHLPIWPKWLFLYFKIKKIVKFEKIEQIFVGQILPLGTLAMLSRLPFVVMTYSMDLKIIKNCPRKVRLVKRIIKKAQALIANSDYTKDLLVNYGAIPGKVVVSYPCASIENLDLDLQNIQNFKNKYNPENKKILLTTGRLVKRKGVDMVLYSLKKVIEQVPDVLYLIGGTGEYEEKLRQLAHELRLDEHIKFIGYVDEDELPYLYNLADVFTMASRELANGDVEGFGIVFLEANLYGKPVIGGDSGGVSSAVKDNYSGLLVNPESKEEISAAIVKILTNPELAAKLGRQGRERALSEFQWPVQAKKIIDILE